MFYVATVAYAFYFVATVSKNDFWIDLVSIVCSFSVFLFLVSMINKMGGFKYTSTILAIGILMWSLADVAFFVDTHLHGLGAISGVADTIYLLPNYFFGSSLCIWLIICLKDSRRNLSFFLANTFCVSIITLVVFNKFLIRITGSEHAMTMAHVSAVAYFFANFSVLIMGGYLLYLIGIKAWLKGTVLTTYGIIGYLSIDFYYMYEETIGVDPESHVMNLLYVSFMYMMVLGNYIQFNKQYVFPLREPDWSKKSGKRRLVRVMVILVADIVLMFLGLLNVVEALFIVVAVLAYTIMLYMLNNDVLNERILKQKEKQNEILEERIKEKTQDLTEANEELEKLSSTDLLTGLYNRRYARTKLARISDLARKYKGGYAVFVIDLNHFKPVNDTYGHEMGDRVLMEFGRRMQELPGEYTAYRLGGDEFMIVSNVKEDRAKIENRAECIRELFNTPILLDNYIFSLSGSIGISVYPDDAKDPDTLMNYADAAMYAVKTSAHKDDFKFYDGGLIQEVGRKQRIRDILSNVNVYRDFDLYYQPQVDNDSGRLIGVEVFPRISESLGHFSPAEMIPVAEEMGVMHSLGAFIAESSIETVSKWKDLFDGQHISLNINLSPLQLIDAEYIEELGTLVEKAGLKPANINLDVANEVVMGASDAAKETLKMLGQYGYVLSLNDFGGGDINLAYVMECGFNHIKLSRTLIADMETDENKYSLVRAIVSMAESVGLEITAVGVETKDQVKALSEMGIHRMQGYLFGKPVLADVLYEEFSYGKG